GSVASNLKNDYTPIRLWNYPARRFERTGLQFCGLIMGDHSKAGINTMFNTATVLGVGVNVHGAGFPRNFVASFSEGSTAGFTDVSMTKFFEIARRVMGRRGKVLTEADERMFYAVRQAAEELK
ncbi:MAG: glucose-1-phosphate thymidylyltransferase, partial [Muribaculaceae bacterium]|nr:glucose-1-phosphate thymidylyltransferase [Muribaculaceae bacterium]